MPGFGYRYGPGRDWKAEKRKLDDKRRASWDKMKAQALARVTKEE